MKCFSYCCWACFDVKRLLQCMTCFSDCGHWIELEIVVQEANMTRLEFSRLAPLWLWSISRGTFADVRHHRLAQTEFLSNWMGRFSILEVKECQSVLLRSGFCHDGIDMMVSDWKCCQIAHSHLIELKLSMSLLSMYMKAPTKLHCKFHCSQQPTRSGMEQCCYLRACSINCPTIKKILSSSSKHNFLSQCQYQFHSLGEKKQGFQMIWDSVAIQHMAIEH